MNPAETVSEHVLGVNNVIRGKLYDFSSSFRTYGTLFKTITNTCSFDLIYGPSMCLFCIPILGTNFAMD